MTRRIPVRRIVAAAVASMIIGLGSAVAQDVVDGTEVIDFDRPEAWAQKYFTSVTSFAGFGVSQPRPPGSIALGAEIVHVPSLSRAERTVGFDGLKEEDLNKTDVFGRLRVEIGLPARTTLTLAYTPPIEVDGAEPHMIGAAIERPLFETGAVRWGIRAHGQYGEVEGDFTCPEQVAAAGSDPVANPFGCQEPSRDEFRTSYLGIEFTASHTLRGGRISPFVTVSGNYMESEFRVRARYAGLVDRTTLETDGWTGHATAGARIESGERWTAAAQVLWSPLGVDRPATSPPTNDDLLHVRLLISRSFR